VGLTRAFLYAGARTVVASLWKVADEPTSELMVAFYARLRQGLPKDQALRAAKLALIGQGRRPGSSVDLSSPAYWAAFTMTGDWK
jgi:CHAT domain-containing protein